MQEAADEAPGVAQVRQSFQVIFLLYGLVVPLVTGLFFLIITIQKAGALTLLRAIGAPARRLVTALLVQVRDHRRARAWCVGIALYYPLTLVRRHVAVAAVRHRRRARLVGVLLVLGLPQLAARRPTRAGDRSRRGDHRGGVGR